MDGTLAHKPAGNRASGPSPGTVKATKFFPEPGTRGDPVLRAHSPAPGRRGIRMVTGLGSCFHIHQRSNRL